MTISLRERNRVAAIDRVRTVAFELMSANGFDAVTVEQIAAASNVSASTVYRYFGTKEALVLSSERPAQLVERLHRDESDRTWAESFQRAAVKVWGGDDTAATELALIIANAALLGAWERQLLDRRTDVASAFAARRHKSIGKKDEARAATAVAVLTTSLVTWHEEGGGKKSFDRLIAKSFDAIRSD